mgnify:CR=1 FL=1
MPCLCGDTRCRFCGPRQGNNYCSVCGLWDDEGGCIDPDACLAILRAEDDRMGKLEALQIDQDAL